MKKMNLKIDEIYKKHSKYVYNIALGILRNKAEAEDITHDVFIKLFYSLDSFRGESDIKTYLYRMTVNKAIDFIRNNKLHNEKIETLGVKENMFFKNDLYALLAKLDTEHKVPLLLAEIAGFSYKEIAEILNINIGTVKSRINRAINKLKNKIKEENNGL
ncbi:MAG: RNA polymerase sigma factor [Candidatus Goldbacteria bacterium]|nr:RNA polymerase sigma factor [Candidatus Goldiibacteriota bacterium]